jgi:hypothetical protein
MTGQLESQGVIGCMKKSLTNLNLDKNFEKPKKFKAVPSLKLNDEKMRLEMPVTTRAQPRSTSALSGCQGKESKELNKYFDTKKSFLQGFVNDRDKLRQILSQRNEKQNQTKTSTESILKRSSTTKIIKNL